MLHRFRTFENYFEKHVDVIGDEESFKDYFDRSKRDAQKELHELAYNTLEQAVASKCHELDYEIMSEDKNQMLILNGKNQLFKINLIGIYKGSDYFIEVNLCLLRTDDDSPEDLRFEIPYKVSTINDLFKQIKNFKSIEIMTPKGKKYFLAEQIFNSLNKSIDSNTETNHIVLHDVAVRMERLFRETYGIMLSGANDFEYRDRKYRYTGMALYELTKN